MKSSRKRRVKQGSSSSESRRPKPDRGRGTAPIARYSSTRPRHPDSRLSLLRRSSRNAETARQLVWIPLHHSPPPSLLVLSSPYPSGPPSPRRVSGKDQLSWQQQTTSRNISVSPLPWISSNRPSRLRWPKAARFLIR